MRSMPAAQLFFRTGKGIQRMRANSVWRLAIQEGLLFAVLATCVTVAYAQRPSGPRADEDTFRFRFLGPRAGNRVASIAGVPGDASTYYAGAASGGVWKTTDAGNRWEPIFDKQPVAAIGAIAVAPSDPSVIWVGTGEAWAIRDSDVMGNGVYVSTDSGKSWTHAGLEDTGRIGRIVVHPSNPDIAFVCALGRTTGPQQERGVYRTTDRTTLGARAFCRRKYRLLWTCHGPTQSADSSCGNVASGNAYLRRAERRPGQCGLPFEG